MLILLASTLLGIGLTRPVFADVPRVLNVVPYDVSASTYLNVTVYHSIEDPSIPPHYVDQIRVTWGSNITSLTITAQPLTPDLNSLFHMILGHSQGVFRQ